MSEGFEPYIQICREVLEPLIRADGGEVYLILAEPNKVVMHLAGRCSGCPGFTYTVNTLIKPCFVAVTPDVQVVVSRGVNIPPGAVRIVSDSRCSRSDGKLAPFPSRSSLSGSEEEQVPLSSDVGDEEYCDEPNMSETVVDEEFEGAEAGQDLHCDNAGGEFHKGNTTDVSDRLRFPDIAEQAESVEKSKPERQRRENDDRMDEQTDDDIDDDKDIDTEINKQIDLSTD